MIFISLSSAVSFSFYCCILVSNGCYGIFIKINKNGNKISLISQWKLASRNRMELFWQIILNSHYDNSVKLRNTNLISFLLFKPLNCVGIISFCVPNTQISEFFSLLIDKVYSIGFLHGKCKFCTLNFLVFNVLTSCVFMLSKTFVDHQMLCRKYE